MGVYDELDDWHIEQLGKAEQSRNRWRWIAWFNLAAGVLAAIALAIGSE